MPEQNTLTQEDRLSRLEALVGALVLSNFGPQMPHFDIYAQFRTYLSSHKLDQNDAFFNALMQVLYNRGQDVHGKLLGAIDDRVTQAASAMTHRVEAAELRLTAIQSDLAGYLSAQDLGLDLQKVPLTRYIPVRVFLDTDDEEVARRVLKAVHILLFECDFEPITDFYGKRGSIFRWLFGRSRHPQTGRETASRLEMIEQSLKTIAISKPQADCDQRHASAIAEILQATKDTVNVHIQLGGLQIVKNENGVFGRVLSVSERIEIERNGGFPVSPAKTPESHAGVSTSGISPPTADSLTDGSAASLPPAKHE